jgi:hypothetical protein
MKREKVGMKNAGNEEYVKCHRKLVNKMIAYLVTLKKFESRSFASLIINFINAS